MDKTRFDAELKRLSVLVGNADTMELFNVSYEELLSAVKAMPATQERRQFAERMSKLLMLQASFLVKSYLGRGTSTRFMSTPMMAGNG